MSLKEDVLSQSEKTTQIPDGVTMIIFITGQKMLYLICKLSNDCRAMKKVV